MIIASFHGISDLNAILGSHEGRCHLEEYQALDYRAALFSYHSFLWNLASGTRLMVQYGASFMMPLHPPLPHHALPFRPPHVFRMKAGMKRNLRNS